jgi:hypothetical protein
MPAIAALALLLAPRDSAAMRTTGGVGAQAGVSLFHKRLAFTVNLEAYATGGKIAHPVEETTCHPAPPLSMVGPMVGINFAPGGPRFVAGAIGGTGIADTYNVGGEVGAVWNAAGDRGIGLHLAGEAGVQTVLVSVQSEAFRELSATGGLRFMPAYGSQPINVCA